MEGKRSAASSFSPASLSASSAAAKKISISYTLFMYREELRRRDARYLRLSRTKITLTDNLISKNVRHLHECSIDDLKAINREMHFRKELKMQVKRIRRLQEIGVCNPNPNIVSTEL